MPPLRRFVLLFTAVLAASCSRQTAGSGSTYDLRQVTLPNGTQILCEVMLRPEDQARGMMHRDSLANDRGMLFVHAVEQPVGYWMHNVRIPLDIVWMDSSRRIVEMSPNTPPCQKVPTECPSYGGTRPAMFVLEMNGGSIARHGLKEGDTIQF